MKKAMKKAWIIAGWFFFFSGGLAGILTNFLSDSFEDKVLLGIAAIGGVVWKIAFHQEAYRSDK